MNDRRSSLSVHISGLAVVLLALAAVRWLLTRMYLSRAKKSIFR